MGTTDEFFNAHDTISTARGDRSLISSTDYRGIDLRVFQGNAEALEAIFALAGATPGATVYIPPGRYYIGRTWNRNDPTDQRGSADATGVGTELFGDLVVPASVTLKFAPGAVLVPFDYSHRRDRDDWAWGVPGRPWEKYKVRIEVQGTIDAGVQQIFDVLLENLNDPDAMRVQGSAEAGLLPRHLQSHQTYYANSLQPAGQVFFTRNAIRAVYPEWWGAAPPPGLSVSGDPMAALVRRTTLAIQAAIDVGHKYRTISVGRSPDPDPMMPVPGLNGTRREASVNLSPSGITSPPIPVLFSRDYVIDRELMVGQPWWESERLEPATPTEQLLLDYQFRGENEVPIVLRGVRGPNRAGAGAARIVASPSHFFGDDRVDLPPSGVPIVDRADFRRYQPRTTEARGLVRSDALLALRGSPGSVVEGLEFDANGTAARCLTVENAISIGRDSSGQRTTGGLASQSIGIERCQFKNATSRLVHIGGEIVASDTVRSNSDGVSIKPLQDLANPLHTWNFQPVHDLSALRFSRCSFNTFPSQSGGTVGVMFFAEETLCLEFDRCAFSGPAAPMVHAVSGRVQFDGCVFWTRDVSGSPPSIFPRTAYRPVAGGIDIFLDVPPLNKRNGRVEEPLSAGICVLRNVHSRSRTLLSTRLEILHGQATTGVLLMRVTHEPEPEPARMLEPAIWWGGALAFRGARLVLLGCRFVRPDGIAGGIREPIGVAMGGGSSFAQFTDPNGLLVNVAASGTNSAGHVIDLGTRVQSSGGVRTKLLTLSPTVARGSSLAPDGSLTDSIEALQIFERYKTQAR